MNELNKMNRLFKNYSMDKLINIQNIQIDRINRQMDGWTDGWMDGL